MTVPAIAPILMDQSMNASVFDPGPGEHRRPLGKTDHIDQGHMGIGNLLRYRPLLLRSQEIFWSGTMAGSDSDRVWELMDKISTCMLTTHDGGQIRSRPMAAFVRRDEDAVYFLGDARR